MDGEANRSGDHLHWKDSLLYKQIQEEGVTPCQ